MTELGADWRLIEGVASAWYDAPSLVDGAALAGRVTELSGDVALDLRTTGVRVRLGDPAQADVVSAYARELGLTADPGVLQQLGLALESPDPSAVTPFWQRVLDYSATDGGLADPRRRDPGLRVRPSTESRPLRHRIHLDVVRPAASLEEIGLGAGAGPWGVRHADTDGNEVDLLASDPLGEGPGTSDWLTVWGAMACYRTTSPVQQRDLAAAAAALADAAGFPLLVDLRPGLVVLDTGKDQAEAEAHGLALDFEDLAADLQAAARELGAVADPRLPRLVQVFLDAADVDAVRAFWAAALGYAADRRDDVSDLVDPRRLGPVLVFQELDAADTGRRRQRNRLQLELAVPQDVAQARVAAAVAAGGRLLDESADRWRVSDPEGNELVVSPG